MEQVKDIIMNKIIEDDDWGKDDLSLERFHPSTAGYCERQIFLSKIHAKTFPVSVRGAMQCGTIIHHWIQNINEIKKNFDIELPVTTTVPESNIYFKGNADLVAKDKSIVIDLKTINSLSYVKSSPMKEHVYQILIYMQGLDITRGKLIYINKLNLETVEHVIVMNQTKLKKVYDKVKNVYTALKVWDAKEIWGDLPFSKCGCFHCNVETLNPQFESLLLKKKLSVN